MMNFFNSIYLQPDNYLAAGHNQRRMIFTDRQFEHPFSRNPETLRQIGIVDVVSSMAEVTEKYGGLAGVWEKLYTARDKIVVVAGGEMMMALLISYWKSILANPTLETLYSLYKFTINSENLFFHNLKLIDSSEAVVDLIDEGRIVTYSLEEFRRHYDAYEAVPLLQKLKPEEIPLEYLLANYFAGSSSQPRNRAMFNKVIKIVTENIIAVLSNDRRTFFISTHNQYLAYTGADGENIEDPLTMMEKAPQLAWLFDTKFSPENYDYVMAKYGYAGLKEIYGQYNAVFAKGGPYFDTEVSLDYLMQGDVPGLLNYDIQDENANFFTDRAFVKKINSLFISHLYQLMRRDKSESLAGYALA